MGNVSNVAKRNKVLDLIRRFSSKNASSKYQTEEDHSSFSASRSSDYAEVRTIDSSENTSNASLQFDEAIWLFTDSDQESTNTAAAGGNETPALQAGTYCSATSTTAGYQGFALHSSSPGRRRFNHSPGRRRHAHLSQASPIDAPLDEVEVEAAVVEAAVARKPTQSPLVCNSTTSADSSAEIAGRQRLESFGAAPEPVRELKNMFDAVLNMDTDLTDDNRSSTAGMSETSCSRNMISSEAAARLGAGDQPLSPEQSSRSQSCTSRQCSAQVELLHDPSGSSTAGATATASSACAAPETDEVSKRIERFEEYCFGFSSAVSTVLLTFEPVLDVETFAVAAQRYKEKLLFPCDIEYAFRGGAPVKIGSGEFGDVFVGRLVPERNFVAIKALKKDRTDLLSLLQEAFTMQLASGTEFAARYYGLVPIGPLGAAYQKLGLVCEFIGDTQSLQPSDFRHALKDLQSRQTLEKTLQLVWLDVSLKMAKAISTFHEMGILLNDIKTDNILLRQNGANSFEPVFIDFGLASIGEGITLAIDLESQTKEELMKEYSHIAPEVLFGGHSNVVSDMYSFGKVLTQISEPLKVHNLQALADRCVAMEPSHRATCSVIIDVISCTFNDLQHHQPQCKSVWPSRFVNEESQH